MLARPAWRGAALLLTLIVGLGVLPFAGLVPDPLATDSSLVATGIRDRAPVHVRLTKQVYGYLPYWELNRSTAAHLRYDLLTTIALFGIGITATGELDQSTPGYASYMSKNAAAVINAAHARGVRVVPTFQLFDFGKLRDLRAFLGSTTAQQQFIKEAIALIALRKADGANIDVEPVPSSLAPEFASFISRFGKALKKRWSDATLVVALGAGVAGGTIDRVAPLVDQIFLMGYDYRTTNSSTAGAVAPLDARWLSVRADVERYLRHAPAGKVILGMPAYGYDWPVKSTAPNARVRTDAHQVGVPFSVTLGAIDRFLDLHPGLPVRYDATADSPYFTYHDHLTNTYRQVWFEDARSLSRKMDLALVSRLAGVGIWALDADPSFTQVWDVLHAKLRAPVHRVVVRGSLFHVTKRKGQVLGQISALVQNRGTVPEMGQLGWAVRDPKGHLVASGSVSLTIDSHGARRPRFNVELGSAARLPAGTYRVTLVFGAGGRHWSAPTKTFRQRF